MKKYKLIKTYPNSPKLDTIVNWHETGNYAGNYMYQKSREMGLYGISGTKCEDHPEFWQLVVEKEYEILSFKNISNTPITFTLRGNGLYSSLGDNIEGCLPEIFFLDDMKPHLVINSVKRLSDGEVFTISDNTTEGTILSLKIISNNLVIEVPVLNIGLTHIYLKDIKKAKTKLFTTEDGVDIFEGDKYYVVDQFQLVKLLGLDLYTFTATKYSQKIKATSQYFSTKQVAEDHILMNKPCLSLNDVKGLSQRTGLNHPLNYRISRNKLRELVKSKLNM